MATLVFQIHIMQWHKGQRWAEEEPLRAETITRHPIAQSPQYSVFDTACIIDQYGDDIPTNQYPDGRIKTALLKDGRIKIDRFYVRNDEGFMTLTYAEPGKTAVDIASLNNGWVQASYQWRYPVETEGEIYWLYESVTLNAALIAAADRDYFLSKQPAHTFSGP